MSNNVRSKLTVMSKIFVEVIDEYESLKNERNAVINRNKDLHVKCRELEERLSIKEAEQEEEALLICNLKEQLETLQLNYIKMNCVECGTTITEDDLQISLEHSMLVCEGCSENTIN